MGTAKPRSLWLQDKTNGVAQSEYIEEGGIVGM
jgi:hypothetical protein